MTVVALCDSYTGVDATIDVEFRGTPDLSGLGYSAAAVFARSLTIALFIKL